MLRKGGQFNHWEPPYILGEVIVLPNGWPREYAIEYLPPLDSKTIPWRGVAGDSVVWQIGTRFRPIIEGNPMPWLYAVRPDGYLDFAWSPR